MLKMEVNVRRSFGGLASYMSNTMLFTPEHAHFLLLIQHTRSFRALSASTGLCHEILAVHLVLCRGLWEVAQRPLDPLLLDYVTLDVRYLIAVMIKQTMRILELAPAALASELQHLLVPPGDTSIETSVTNTERAVLTAAAAGTSKQTAVAQQGGQVCWQAGGSDGGASESAKCCRGLVPHCLYELQVQWAETKQQHVVVYQPRQQQKHQGEQQQEQQDEEHGALEAVTEEHELTTVVADGPQTLSGDGHGAETAATAGAGAAIAAAGAAGSHVEWQPDAETLELIRPFPDIFK